jgi:hypothetical protein
MTRRVAFLACLAASIEVVAKGMPLPQGLGISITPGQPNKLIIAFGSSPYEIGTLQLMFQGKTITFTAQEIWDTLKSPADNKIYDPKF